MPLYDYACESCGPFRAWNSIDESQTPVACPVCDRPSGRSITAPFLNDMNGNSRVAHQRNERSAHEPRVASRKQHDKSGTKRPHRHHHHSQRPWMIGH